MKSPSHPLFPPKKYSLLTNTPLPANNTASHPAASLGLECVNAAMHLSAFVYLSAFIGGLLFCRGSVCGAARAAAVFGALSFLVWAASAALAGRQMAGAGTGSGRQQQRKAEKESRLEEGGA